MGQETMEAKFKQAIKEHLPEQVGEELKRVIEEHGRLKRDGEAKDDQIRHLERVEAKQRAKLDRHATIDGRDAAVSAREKAVEQAEIRQEVANLKQSLAAEQDKSVAFQRFMDNIARNVDYRRSFFGEVPVGYKQPSRDVNGYEHTPGEVMTARVDQTTTETSE